MCMDMDKIVEGLKALFDSTVECEFHKSSYESYMDEFQTRCSELLSETARACDRSAEDMERIAACIPEYVSDELHKITSKRKRDLRAMDMKMAMVAFYVPLMGEIPSLQARELSKRTVDIWNEKMPEYKIGYSTYDGIKGGFKKGFFSCYITTAVCRSMNKPDDCYELTTLREYRDGYLMHSEGGQQIVEEYYDIAPTIVKRIGRKEDADEIYRGIWEKYLNPCIRLIEEDRREECRDLYITMVRRLEKEYFYS